jgi:pilus assembly protein Flp/PilA
VSLGLQHSGGIAVGFGRPSVRGGPDRPCFHGPIAQVLKAFFGRSAGRDLELSQGVTNALGKLAALSGNCPTSHLSRKTTSMSQSLKYVVRFLQSEDGPTAVEYAIMLALIVIVCVTSIALIGTRANLVFNTIGNALPAGS